MEESKSDKQGRLNTIVVIGFAVIAMTMLVMQLGMDVMSTIEQQAAGQSSASQAITVTETPPANATPAEPTPTFDIGSVKIHG